MHYSYDTIIIGGGQAGLALGRELARSGTDFLILDASERTGDAWRNRWDSLTLFTPAEHCSLPGLPFPAPAGHYPTKDEVADYLELYASRFALPIRHGRVVVSLRRDDDAEGYLIETPTEGYRARSVVIATGPFSAPHIPAVAGGLSAGVVQLHSSTYRNPDQLPKGTVVVVGGGSSGVQIAAELSETHRTVLAVGSPDVRLPRDLFGASIFTWLDRVGALDVAVDSPIGRRASRREFVIEHSPTTIARTHDIELVDRIVSATGKRVTTHSGRAIEVDAVVWATGYRASYPWVDLPIFATDGRPQQKRGVTALPGLYFLGLPWMHSRGSALLGWVGRDAAYLAEVIAARRIHSGLDAIRAATVRTLQTPVVPQGEAAGAGLIL